MDLFSASQSTGWLSGPMDNRKMWWVYALGALFFFVAILMILNYRFNLLPSYLDPRPMKSKVNASSQEFWSAPDAITPLRVSTADIRSKIPATRYTVMFEVVWINSRTRARENMGAFPYRHILHRGSGDLSVEQNNLLDIRVATPSPPTPTAAMQDMVASSTPGTASFGLPVRMNPGILADPYTNDMLIYIDTESNNTNLRESLRIPDIPLDQPFYLTIVVIDNVVEVYLNCRLEATKVLEGQPRSVEQEWYGLTGAHALPAQVQHLKLWDRPLSHKELRDLCPLPIAFGPNMKCPEGMSQPMT